MEYTWTENSLADRLPLMGAADAKERPVTHRKMCRNRGGVLRSVAEDAEKEASILLSLPLSSTNLVEKSLVPKQMR